MSSLLSSIDAPSTAANNPDPSQKPNNGDSWRFLLIELINQLGLLFTHARQAKGVRATAVLFDQVMRLLDVIDKMPGHEGILTIRRIAPSSAGAHEKPDYYFSFGNKAFRGADLIGWGGHAPRGSSHLATVLDQTFACFNDLGIFALSIQLPGKSPERIDQLRLALNIVARFRQAVENNASITFRSFGRALRIPLVRDRGGKPDPNLMLVAGLNGLSSVNMRELIKQAEAFYDLSTPDAAAVREVDDYNQIFYVRSLRSQLIKPLVEMNNLPWMRSEDIPDRSATAGIVSPVDGDIFPKPGTDSEACRVQPALLHEDYDLSPAYLSGYLAGHLAGTDHQTQEAVTALFEWDFASPDMEGLAKTMGMLTRLLHALEKHVEDPAPMERLLLYLHDRMGRIPDETVTHLSVQRRGLRIEMHGRTLLVGMVHPHLLDVIALAKERVAVQRKIAAFREHAFDIGSADTQFLVEYFNLSDSAAAEVLQVLRQYLASDGAVDRVRFADPLGAFARHEGSVFEIGWCLLRQTPQAQDRTALLASLPLLGERLKDPKSALAFLLTDLFQAFHQVEPSDRNAFALATLMLRTHHKERRVDIDRTPEDVLAVKKSLNAQLVKYAAWRMDIDPMRILSKFKSIREALCCGMQDPTGKILKSDLGFRSLLAVEREGLIFVSLAGGKTARMVLRDALDYYGEPRAEIYQGQLHPSYLIDLMAHLRIVLRGMARLGQPRDLDTLKAMEQRASRLMALDTDPAYARRVQQMLQWVAPAMRAIQVQPE
ncbi:MAG: hypothetical protein WAU91_06845 [Desulfatitalea sp.]